MVQLGLIGYGRAGRFHFESISNIAGAQVHAICDPNINSDAVPVLHLSRLEDLLAIDQIDAVVVASPTTFHYDHIQACLKAQKHVFAEKPVGKSLNQIKDCFDLAKEQNRLLFTGFQRRYDPNFLELKGLLPNLGPARIVKSCSRDNPKPELEFLKTSGNIFHDMLVHDFDMLIHLLGFKVPHTIFTSAHAYDKEIAALNDYDTTLVTLKYHDGLMCAIDTSRTSIYGYDQRIEVYGAEGMAQAENLQQNSVKWSNAQGIHTAPLLHSFPERYQLCYYLEMKDFIKHLGSSLLFNISPSQVMLSHILVEAAHASVVQQRAIDLHKDFSHELDLINQTHNE